MSRAENIPAQMALLAALLAAGGREKAQRAGAFGITGSNFHLLTTMRAKGWIDTETYGGGPNRSRSAYLITPYGIEAYAHYKAGEGV